MVKTRIVLHTSTSVNVANGSSVLTAAYFSSLWRYQLKIFTVCPRTQKLNFLRFLRACDRLSSCYICFPVTFGMPLIYTFTHADCCLLQRGSFPQVCTSPSIFIVLQNVLKVGFCGLIQPAIQSELPQWCTTAQFVHHLVIFNQKFNDCSPSSTVFTRFSILCLRSISKIETSVKRVQFWHYWGNSDWIAGCIRYFHRSRLSKNVWGRQKTLEVVHMCF